MKKEQNKNCSIRIGGQAVMEGVMIKSENFYAVSARKGSSIVSMHEKLKNPKSKFYRMPVARGFFNMIAMLKVGMKALMWSAEQAGEDAEKLGKKEIFVTIAVSIAAVIIFFILLPYFAANFIGFNEERNPAAFNLIDGIIRISLFLIYLIAISFMKDVKRLFQYHGAEHMAVHCYEKNMKLSKNNVRKYPTMHPRCGTSFLLLVFIISIIVFSFVPSILMLIYPKFNMLNIFARKILLFAARIIMIPLIAGISYEILKISDKYQSNIIFKLISLPGILLQKITTKNPTNAQIEVAINSVKKVVEMESIRK